MELVESMPWILPRGQNISSLKKNYFKRIEEKKIP